MLCITAACTQELSSTGAPSDPLRSCTNGTLKINTVGTACNSTCGSGKLTVTCTALGQWNVDSQCAPLSELVEGLLCIYCGAAILRTWFGWMGSSVSDACASRLPRPS